MNVLPKTPFENLKISPFIKGIIITIHFFIRILGLWKYPMKRAAANFEEMSFIDKIYWAYKSKYIVKIPLQAIFTIYLLL